MGLTDVLDVEVVSDETTFTPDHSHIPLSGSRFGWCNDGNHVRCKAVLPDRKHPDPGRKGAYYTLPGRRCPCACHARNLD